YFTCYFAYSHNLFNIVTQIIPNSNFTTIFLLGFHNMGKCNLLVFILILLMYCVTICGNLLIITLVSYSKTLHSPMYFFLSQLSASDIIYSVASFLIHGVCSLEFCGPNTIDQLFCDFAPVVKLSCSDASIVQMESTLLSTAVAVLPFLLIVLSYIYIALTILKISSVSGRLKSFSTCSSHLTVVSIFYGTLISMYVFPNEGKSQTISKILTLMYTVFTPFINPFIYSLRNKDIKNAL
ncbi:hypothetical protein AB205_0064510, partial [Aquarana catesbeiana]